MLNRLSNIRFWASLATKHWCFSISEFLDNQLVGILDVFHSLSFKKGVFLDIKNDLIYLVTHLRGNSASEDWVDPFLGLLIETVVERIFSIDGCILISEVEWSW